MTAENGGTDLHELLAGLEPTLLPDTYVFCCLPAAYGERTELEPFAAIREPEGLTLIVPEAQARAAGIEYDACFRCITLAVHSSLVGVGLTAAVSRALAERGIGVNVVAAFHHDHLLVPAEQAERAVEVLISLSQKAKMRGVGRRPRLT